MGEHLKSIERLISAFHRLPGVGLKSAERMAYSLLEQRKEDIEEFSNALLLVKDNVHLCPNCGLYTENDLCSVCDDKTREDKEIIVVSHPKDIAPFEKLNTFKGRYHCLHGVISPSKDISIEDLNIASLIKKIETGDVKEVILATNPTIEGETTAMYLSKMLSKYDIVVSRLAYGLPMGASLEYADALTLTKSLEGRKKVE